MIVSILRDGNPDVGAQIDRAAYKAVVAITVISGLLGAQSGIALADGIALVAKTIVKDVVITHGQEARIALPHTIDEVGIVNARALEQAVAHKYVSSVEIKLAIIEDGVINGIECSCAHLGAEAVKDAVVKIGPHLVEETIAILDVKDLDDRQ